MSALGSGLDVVIEVSSDYIDRIIREKFRRIGRICFASDSVPVRVAGQDLVVEVRRVIPAIDSVWLTAAPLDTLRMTVNVRLRLLYGQVRDELWGDQWKTLDELNVAEEDRLFTFSAGLAAVAEFDRVVLTIDSTAVPDWAPRDLRDMLDEVIPIPLDFLQQRQTYTDNAGVSQTLTLLRASPDSAVVKVVDGNLAIGIDLDLSQDDDPKELRPGADVAAVLPDDLVSHTCGLPDQIDVSDSDLETFYNDFTESFLQNSDWAVALDAHVVDAMLRGLPSAGMNREGDEPEENCDHRDAARRFCLKLVELQDGLILVRGRGEVFICEDTDTVDVVPNDWYEACVRADVTLTLTPPPRRRLSGHYVVTSAALCGADADLDCCLDVMKKIPEKFKENTIRLAVPTRFGDPDDPAGELEMEAVETRTDGLVLRGSGSLRTGARPILEAPETVLFATGCDDDAGPYTRTFTISNAGGVSLHVCPLVIREVENEDPDSAFTNAGLFTVTRPERLADGGQGATLRRGDRRDVRVQLNAEPGQRYTALLDIPNNAEVRTIKLVGDLRPASVAALPETLFIEHVDYELACHQGYPPARPIRVRFEVTNEGPGNLQICEIEFTTNPSNPDGDPVFYGSGHPYMAEGETGTVNVIFVPGESGVGSTYRGRMLLVTNAGDHSVGLLGQLEHSVDERLAGVLGSFDSDVFCGDADWDAVQDSGGAILDVKQVGEFLSLLGGDPCCPPPKGPACLCVDFWEAAFQDVPPGVELEILDGAGSVIAANQARFRTRILMVPIKEKNGYALRARVPQTTAGGKSSSVILRRWVAQQDGLYNSEVPLTDLACAGSYAYAAGPSGLDVVNLKDPLNPVRAAQIAHMAGVTSLSALGKRHLLAAEGGLKVFDLANPEQPKAIGSLPLTPGIRAVFATRVGEKNLAVACGPAKQLHVLDLSDPAHPEEIGSAATHVMPGRLLARGGRALLVGKEGLELFDLSKPKKPESAGLLSTEREARNAALLGSFALLAYDSQSLDMVDISKPKSPSVAGSLRMEKWVSEFTPLAGAVVRFGGRFLALKGDQLGFRVMRLRRNHVDLAALHRKRGLA